MSTVPAPLRRPVVARDPSEPGRAATPLELLFDLVFVVAVASNAATPALLVTLSCLLVALLVPSMGWVVFLIGVVLVVDVGHRVAGTREETVSGAPA
jgi:low temperature requirement protein LtrA